MFRDLLSYKEEHGHVDMAYNNTKANPHGILSRWVRHILMCQRKQEEVVSDDAKNSIKSG